jgi:hypothetical protein
MLRLRKRRSARGRLINALDRSLGWIVVTIVGFITAMVAFMIVRSEQWLFNLKEGYCNASVFKAKRFCCPSTVKALAQSATSLLVSAPSALMSSEPDSCDDWTTWADAFGLRADKGHSKLGFESWAVEYIAYTVIAVSLLLRFPESLAKRDFVIAPSRTLFRSSHNQFDRINVFYHSKRFWRTFVLFLRHRQERTRTSRAEAQSFIFCKPLVYMVFASGS